MTATVVLVRIQNSSSKQILKLGVQTALLFLSSSCWTVLQLNWTLQRHWWLTRGLYKRHKHTHTHLHVCSSEDWTSILLNKGLTKKRAQSKRKHKECTWMTAVWPENTSANSDALKSPEGRLCINDSVSALNFLGIQTLIALKFVNQYTCANLFTTKTEVRLYYLRVYITNNVKSLLLNKYSVNTSIMTLSQKSWSVSIHKLLQKCHELSKLKPMSTVLLSRVLMQPAKNTN